MKVHRSGGSRAKNRGVRVAVVAKTPQRRFSVAAFVLSAQPVLSPSRIEPSNRDHALRLRTRLRRYALGS